MSSGYWHSVVPAYRLLPDDRRYKVFRAEQCIEQSARRRHLRVVDMHPQTAVIGQKIAKPRTILSQNRQPAVSASTVVVVVEFCSTIVWRINQRKTDVDRLGSKHA